MVACLLSVAIPALMLAAMYLKQWEIEVVKIPAVLTLILTWMLALPSTDQLINFVFQRIDADVFVKSQADLDARLASLDLAPDPDGRYRINDFCCNDTTWQATVIELMCVPTQ